MTRSLKNLKTNLVVKLIKNNKTINKLTAIEYEIKKFADELQSNILIVDVGCGTQPYKKYFFRQQYMGIDIKESGRPTSQKCPDQYFDGLHIPMDDQTVDAIICTEVLEHALDHEILISEMFRVLKAGGKLCLTVPFIWGLHETPYDFRRFTPYGLAEVTKRFGFEIYDQRKLVQGIQAVSMLVESEINNYLSNKSKLPVSTKLAIYFHRKIFRILKKIWINNFSFERIYIDNIIVAGKPMSKK